MLYEVITHLVREIDALDGLMGKVIRNNFVQHTLYEVIRAAYDRYGHAAFEQGAGGFGGNGGFGFGGFDFNFGGMGGMSDIFEEVFGDS